MTNDARQSAPSRGRHVTVDGVRLHYLDLENSGGESMNPPILLIPGITSPAITWEFVGRRLAAFTRVLILDNRGRGLSSGGAELGYSLEDYGWSEEKIAEAFGPVTEQWRGK